FRKNPPRDAAGIGLEQPALLLGEIDEREFRFGRPDEPIGGPDPGEVGERRVVAGQHEVIAVVDLDAERVVDIGAAAPAGLAGRLVHDDVRAGIADAQRRREPGKPGADDVNAGRGHQGLLSYDLLKGLSSRVYSAPQGST